MNERDKLVKELDEQAYRLLATEGSHNQVTGMVLLSLCGALTAHEEKALVDAIAHHYIFPSLLRGTTNKADLANMFQAHPEPETEQ